MAKKIRGILVDVHNGITTFNQEINSAKDIADLLNCEYVECVKRNIGGQIVDIYCDEEALLKQAREPAIVTKNKSNKIIEVIYGNCLLCLHTKNGNMKSLPHRMFEPILLTSGSFKTNDKWYQCLQCRLL